MTSLPAHLPYEKKLDQLSLICTGNPCNDITFHHKIRMPSPLRRTQSHILLNKFETHTTSLMKNNKQCEYFSFIMSRQKFKPTKLNDKNVYMYILCSLNVKLKVSFLNLFGLCQLNKRPTALTNDTYSNFSLYLLTL